MASYSNIECYDAMDCLNGALVPHVLDWIYNEDFDKVTIPDEVPEAMLMGWPC